ncbi:Protein of unknown function [Pustulibacterium marinum]|uniref:DUF4238 domain-containing protein n=1 Tax=Pustulibacterium marinum TaxID=1224947 RepID=A0A1I7H0C3_9FLAO|nr:DUF4238 domain-containing protein [Pustulibacterium marinum]SFU54092.1 Protein of unknown function [Pustulibacterium marinum]
MKTEKKNQHFIPKFYLKHFSYCGNKKQIGIFNTRSRFFFSKSSLKHQGSKNFFYGYDGVIEDKLANIEGHLSTSIKKIILDKKPPEKFGFEHFQLLNFVALTHLRNPVSVQSVKDSREIVKKRFLELDPKLDIDNFIPSTTHEESIEVVLSNLMNVVDITVDLDFKLLINKTKIPFISSDFPIVKYNQFLELKSWKRGKTGFGNTGLQIFIPLNPKLTIAFFDSRIYKIGNKKNSFKIVDNEEDVNQLNLLQFLNCYETVYFNGKCSEHYIRTLFERSGKFKKAHEPYVKLSHSSSNGKEIDFSKAKDIITILRTDCEIRLNIQGIKTHSNARKINMEKRENILRPKALQMMK